MNLPRVRVKIEIPMGSRVKYEYNLTRGVIEVDRILPAPMPFNYGFVPATLWEDGDPLDVIMLCDSVLHPGVELEAYPVGMVRMWDQGESDFKLVCSLEPVDFGTYSPDRKRVVQFLKNYKTGVVIRGVETRPEAIYRLISKAKRDWDYHV